MFVKLFTQILDSSIADNRRLRHFFTDLLLCSDSKGFVMMTPTAIARRIGTTVEEVEWGLAELEKPDPHSKTPDHQGRRITRLDGVGYGWYIINYEAYRALKDGDQMREATKQRVKRFREKAKAENVTDCNASVTPCNADVTHVTLGNAITEGEEEAEGEEENKVVKVAKAPKKFIPPTIDELRAFCKSIGHEESDGDAMFYMWEANGWKNGKAPCKNWKAGVRRYASEGWLKSQKQAQQLKPKQPQKHVSYNDGLNDEADITSVLFK